MGNIPYREIISIERVEGMIFKIPHMSLVFPPKGGMTELKTDTNVRLNLVKTLSIRIQVWEPETLIEIGLAWTWIGLPYFALMKSVQMEFLVRKFHQGFPEKFKERWWWERIPNLLSGYPMSSIQTFMRAPQKFGKGSINHRKDLSWRLQSRQNVNGNGVQHMVDKNKEISHWEKFTLPTKNMRLNLIG